MTRRHYGTSVAGPPTEAKVEREARSLPKAIKPPLHTDHSLGPAVAELRAPGIQRDRVDGRGEQRAHTHADDFRHAPAEARGIACDNTDSAEISARLAILRCIMSFPISSIHHQALPVYRETTQCHCDAVSAVVHCRERDQKSGTGSTPLWNGESASLPARVHRLPYLKDIPSSGGRAGVRAFGASSCQVRGPLSSEEDVLQRLAELQAEDAGATHHIICCGVYLAW